MLLPGLERSEDPYRAAEEADCLLILTEWSDFQLLDWNRIGESMKNRDLIDTRNLLAPELLKKHGFNYISLGQN